MYLHVTLGLHAILCSAAIMFELSEGVKHCSRLSSTRDASLACQEGKSIWPLEADCVSRLARDDAQYQGFGRADVEVVQAHGAEQAVRARQARVCLCMPAES